MLRLRTTAACLYVTIVCACTQEDQSRIPQSPAGATSYVGAETCIGCHPAQGELWRNSHHDRAMQIADTTTVIGNFSGVAFESAGIAARFLTRDQAYWIATAGPDGSPSEFEVKYTFGIEPLQQYLVALSNGRYQAFPVAWDTRTAANGGQRWFDLYPNEQFAPVDPLHWIGRLQNWNAMCADCHSTNLEKNYAAEFDQYATTWSSLNVSCEACHGPGSDHALAPTVNKLALGAVERTWVHRDTSGIAQRAPDGPDRRELETCGRCHSRRVQLRENFEPGQPLLNYYRPTLLASGLYYPDGQILDEVYVYGSFLQSAMHEAGVSCSDCHDPHSGAVRADGNALCSQCHAPAQFDTPAHHHHPSNTGGSKCIACHMPSQTYMSIDARRDHSFRVPRPDLSATLGTPNACTQCHENQTPAWAASTVQTWFPQGRSGSAHYGQAIAAGRHWATDRPRQLLALAQDQAAPAIARATALELMAQQLDDAMLGVVAASLSDREPLVQLAALEALRSMPATISRTLAQDFLDHPLRAVRSNAARLLVPVRAQLSPERRQAYDAALNEYRESQRLNADRAEGQYNLARLFIDLEQPEQAASAFRAAILRERTFIPAYVNLADLHQRSGDEAAADTVLREALTVDPNSSATLLALGLSLVRQGQSAAALATIERAAANATDDPYAQYIWGVALHSTGDRERGLEVLRAAHDRFPAYRDIILALATMHRDSGNIGQAIDYARALYALSPTDPAANSLLSTLGATPP